MAAFDINSILGDQSQPRQIQRFDVVMVPIESIEPNPRNTEIYLIGDVSALAEDIKTNGLRQPLEVVQDGSTYRLIGGERRWTAMMQLHEAGDARFNTVPCVLRPAGSENDELLALITANSTARELTDGERLAQYEALKSIYERKKAAGEFEGRVRDKLVEVTGMSAGALGRMNAISQNCTEEVRLMLRDGKATLTKCYEASKLWPRQQVDFIKDGYARSLPSVKDRKKLEALYQFIARMMDEKDYTPENAYSLSVWIAENLNEKTLQVGEDTWLIRKHGGGNSSDAFLMASEGDASNMEYLPVWEVLQTYKKMFLRNSDEPPKQEKQGDAGDVSSYADPGGQENFKKTQEREIAVVQMIDDLFKYESIEKYWDKYPANMQAERYLKLDTYRHIFDDETRLELAVDTCLGKNPSYDPNIFVRYLDKDLNPIPMRKDISEGEFNRRGWVQFDKDSCWSLKMLLKPWAEQLVDEEESE